jgi:uncharacterized membrane protein
MRPERIFFALSASFGMAMALLTPPFHAPDESVHFYRAYSVAQGALLAERERALTGDELPVSVIVAANRVTRHLARSPDATFPRRMLAEELERPLDPLVRRFEHFPASATYTPIPYLPAAAAIAFAAGADGSPVEILYAARASNVLVVTLLLAAAIAISPRFKWQLAFAALLPMAVFLRASVSADGLTTALVFLVFSSSVRFTFGARDRIARWTFFTALFLLPLTKAFYSIVALLALLPADAGRRARLLFAGGAALALAAGLILTAPFAQRVMESRDAVRGVDARAQIARALQEPLRTASVIAADPIIHAPRYTAHVIGRLGVLDAPLPVPLLALYALGFVTMLLFSDGRPAPSQRVLATAIFLAGLFGIIFSLYAAWTPVGASRVEGVQGRYFIPLLPLLFLAFANRRFASWMERPWFPGAFLGFHAAGLTATLGVLLLRYWV